MALLLAGSVAVFAQTAPVSGKVELKKADGSTEPVQGALVEVFRTDIKAKLPSDKTNKKGEFNFAGLPLGATFVLSVSAPGAKPGYMPNIKAGNQNLVVTLSEGDGKRWTEEEIRAALEGASTAATPTTSNTELTEEQKKQQAEYEQKLKEVNAKNEKIKQQTAAVQKSLDEGNQAFNSKNYDVAIVKFEEGYKASPDFVGSAPVLLNNKASALKIRAVNTYNESVKSSDAAAKSAGMTKVRQDLSDALDAYDKSWKVISSAPAADITDPKNLEINKMNTLSGAKDAIRLMAVTKQVDTSKSDAARALITEYVNVEADQAKKAEAERILGDFFLATGEADSAVAEYRKAVDILPEDPDALAGLGLSLVNTAYKVDGSIDKEKMQEALNYLQKFTEVAPANHQYLDDAKGLISTLKKEQNLTPKKTASTKKKN